MKPPPSAEELLKQATVLYNEIRDQSKEVAIHNIALTILRANSDGANRVFDFAEERIKFMKAAPITEA